MRLRYARHKERTAISGNERLGNLFDIHSVMKSLAARRPVFHSEADFQFALAWRIHELEPDCEVRLEFKPFPQERVYLDIWLPTLETAIELKYATQTLDTECVGERFALKSQSAQDQRRYDFLKDVERLERIVSYGRAKRGLAIMLTNDTLYWKPPQQNWQSMADAAFRIHDGLPKIGELRWSPSAGEGTTRSRTSPICLTGAYVAHWANYSRLDANSNSQFRYLAFEVGKR